MTQDEVQQAREALRRQPSKSPKFGLGSLLSPLLEALDNVLWRLVDAVKVKAEAINRRTAGDALGTNAAASASHSAAFHGTWYVYIDQVVCGPCNGSEIRNLFVEGRINQQNQVVRVGAENWTKASDDPALHNFIIPTKDELSKIALDTSSDNEEPIGMDAVRAALKSQTEQPQTPAQVKSGPKKRTISTKTLIFIVGALVCFVFAPFFLYLDADEKVGIVILIIIIGIWVFSTLAVVKVKDWMNARGLKVGLGTLVLAWIAFKFVPGAFVAPTAPEPAGPHVVRGDTWGYQQVAKEYVGRELKDPDSAKYGDTWLVVKGGPKGMRICGTVNAKNSFGAYAGESALYVADYKGGVVALIDDAAEQACDDLIAEAKTLP